MSLVHDPGSRLGIMGGGQLGRMLASAAQDMGYRVHVFSPETDSPAAQVADVAMVGDYDNETAVRDFARGVDVLTFEFENIPRQTIAWAAEHCEVCPGAEVLHITQNRRREKQFLSSHGFPVAPWCPVDNLDELPAALEKTGYPAVLKTAVFGYDGKGQAKINSPQDLPGSKFEGAPFVLEAWVPFAMEISVVVARGKDGRCLSFPAGENIHRHHILDATVVPARVAPDVSARAAQLAATIADRIGLVGVMGVELFLLPDGSLLVNELAPRTHNSGHFTMDACVTSQFEQQLRAVCGLPLGSVELLRPCAMVNLLGDLWSNGEPDWPAALSFADVKLHLYGKREARPGRKMGHLTAMAPTAEAALELAKAARAAL